MRRNRQGTLTVIAGPMFAGKSAALIARARQHGDAVLALKPAFDNRLAHDVIASRDSASIPALAIAAWPSEAAAHPVLVLDEAQFMASPHYAGDVVADIMDALAQGASVTVGGLDTDYLRRPFEIMTRLASVADEHIRLQARCHVCNQPAIWTAKKHDTGEVLEVGDTELYEARCDIHWTPPE